MKKEENLLPVPLAGVNLPEDNQKLAMNLQPPAKPVAQGNDMNLKLPDRIKPVLKNSDLSNDLSKAKLVTNKVDEYMMKRPNLIDKQQLQQPIKLEDSDLKVKENLLEKDDTDDGALRKKRDLGKDDSLIVDSDSIIEGKNHLKGRTNATARSLEKPIADNDIVSKSKDSISGKIIDDGESNKNEEMRRRLKNVQDYGG